jgi:hypothetical protein
MAASVATFAAVPDKTAATATAVIVRVGVLQGAVVRIGDSNAPTPIDVSIRRERRP